MASSYLDLYTGAGHMRQGGSMGSSTAYNPGNFQIGTPQNIYWQAGDTQKVVHDQANNKYYGTQSQADLTKGLTESLARLQSELDKGGKSSWQTGWFGNSGQMQFNKFDSKTIANQNAQIASQQKYLDQINNGMYKQEGNQFFDSYDDHTGGWNNVFKKRYDNSVIDAKNVKTTARNEKIADINERNKRKNSDINQGDATKSKAIASPITPKLEVNTGMASETTKNRKKVNAILVDNGLNI